jgi:hypothetical protein
MKRTKAGLAGGSVKRVGGRARDGRFPWRLYGAIDKVYSACRTPAGVLLGALPAADRAGSELRRRRRAVLEPNA